MKFLCAMISVLYLISCQNATSSKDEAKYSVIEKAEGLYKQGSYMESYVLLEEYLKTFAKDAYAYYLQGKNLNELGLHEEAIKVYTIAISLDSKNALYLNDRASAYMDQAEFALAENDLKAALKLDSNNAEVQNNLGLVYSYRDQNILALTHHSKAIKLSSKSFIMYVNRAVVYMDLERYSQALKDLDKAIELNESYGLTYLYRGIVNQKLNNLTLACRDYQDALNLGAEDAKEYMIYCR